MGRDAALVTSWGPAVVGREAGALEVFMEFMSFIGKAAAEGKCSEVEPFLATDGSGGFGIVRGKSDALRELSESDENLRLISKAQLYVTDLKTHWYYTGEEVMNLTSIFAQVMGEAGIA
jgi:hypothetical protein